MAQGRRQASQRKRREARTELQWQVIGDQLVRAARRPMFAEDPQLMIENSRTVENQPVEDLSYSKFTWRIEKFSKLNDERHYSKMFSTGSHIWRLLIFPKGNEENHLSLFLNAIDVCIPRSAKFNLAFVNHINNKDTVRKEYEHQFTVKGGGWGNTNFIPVGELKDPHRGFLINDTCIVKAEVTVLQPIRKGMADGIEEYPGAGQLFEEGRYCEDVLDEKFEDIGGFNILKTQASLYKEIWLKYGHIATSQVLTNAYPAQVNVVTEIMDSLLDLHQHRFAEVSSEMIDSLEKKIKMAEKLEFNIKWIPENIKDIKKAFSLEEKLKDELVKAQDELKKAQENVSDLEFRIATLQSSQTSLV